MTNKKRIIFLLALVLLVAIFGFRKRIQEEYANLTAIIYEGNIFDLRFADADSKEIFFYSDSLKIVGDLFLSSSDKPSPCILILHGTNILGRKQPIVLSLAKEFQDLDYTVLTIDFRGYNESQDPLKTTSYKDLDFAQDVVSAINYLKLNTHIDTSRIFILGHSFGAGVSLSAMVRITCVKKYILFGAPRRITERIISYASHERDQLIHKSINNMHLKFPVDSMILLDGIQKRNIEQYVSFINQDDTGLKLLLIDGSREDLKDIRFYKDIAIKLSPKADYYSLMNSDHYLNTGFFLGKPAYNRNLVIKFTDTVHTWLRSS